MFHSMSHAARIFVAGATLALPFARVARAQENRPVVVVFTFTNSSIGAGRADFDGIATGVQDLLITDMASNANIRLVDRSRVNDVLQEQNMVKAGQVDDATAIRIGKIIGAQYAITGGFMAAGKGQAVLTGRTIDLETTQIANPQKITGSSDDVLGMIAQLSTKLATGMNVAAKPGRRVGDAGDAVKGSSGSTTKPSSGSSSSSTPAQAGSAAGAKSTPVEVEHYAKQVTQPEKLRQTKLDAATMKIYSSALDEADKKNKPKAIELFKQVLAKYQGFEPAQRELDRLSH